MNIVKKAFEAHADLTTSQVAELQDNISIAILGAYSWELALTKFNRAAASGA